MIAASTPAIASPVLLDTTKSPRHPSAVGRQEWTCRVASTSPLDRGTACMSSIDHDLWSRPGESMIHTVNDPSSTCTQCLSPLEKSGRPDRTTPAAPRPWGVLGVSRSTGEAIAGVEEAPREPLTDLQKVSFSFKKTVNLILDSASASRIPKTSVAKHSPDV